MTRPRLLLALLSSGIWPLACAPSPDDSMTGELRARVTELRRAVAAEPTTEVTLFERAEVLQEWVDVYSLTGGPVPVNLTLDLTMIRFTGADGHTDWMPPGIEWRWEDTLTGFDRYVEELGIKDDHPGALGGFAWAGSGRATAGEVTTLELHYTAGTRGLEPGGGFLLGRQMMADHGAFQNDDPKAANYVSISSSREGSSFEPHRLPLAGMHGGFFAYRPAPAYRLRGSPLQPGDVVTFTLGDTVGGGPGFRVQTLASDEMLVPFYVDLESRGNFLTPDWEALEVVGRDEVVAVRAVAPSVVAAGEPFTLRVRTEDAFTNRTEAVTPAFTVQLEGADGPLGDSRELPAGGGALQQVEGLSIATGGTYRYRVTSADGGLETLSAPIWVEPEVRRRILWGETHGHTSFAEGQGTPDAFFRYAREDAHLDFVTLSEHDIWLDASEWQTLQEHTRRSNEDGEMIAFLGYEWSAFRSRGGHHNVLFRDAGADLVAMRQADRLPLLYEALRSRHEPQDVLIIPHAHRAGDWTRSDPDLEKMVEIYSMHGSFEWFGNRYLQSGFEIGFVAASDDHRSKPGYAPGSTRGALSQRGGLAAAIAPEKSPDAVFRALRSLSAYATSGERILLEASLNGHPMGTRQPAADRREISARVSGTAPIDRIDVVKNGTVIFHRDFLSSPLASEVTVLVSFESSSEVFGEVVDNPRPYRFWQGTLDVFGARVDAVEPVGLDNPHVDRASIDPERPNRVHFLTNTRGRADTMLVVLSEAGAATRFDFALESTRERGFAQGIRQAQTLPAESFGLQLGEMIDGRIERSFSVGQHTDRIHLQLVDAAGDLDRGIDFTDLEEVADGDYYYVRVVQLDGSRAWSSPFWVGRREVSD
ncbi:MAG: DUF3604 domain-containing protein [Acidobacteriota bacterium]|nr:DUF3604 domain-containing protein [Acidobacteriota bacterium]